MKKPTFITFALIAAGLVIIIAAIYFTEKPPKYSEDPKTWVEIKENIKQISTEKVTKGKGYFDYTTEQYLDINNYIDTAFSYVGIYKGNGFFKEEYYAQAGAQRKLVMEITPELDPDDGVLQGIIIERIFNDIPEAFIFLDGDWKKQFPVLYIVWGSSYQNEKRFEFNQIQEGIYMDRVIDDKNRFTTESYDDVTFGGIIVGDLTKKDIQDGNTNGTIIMLS